MGWASARHGDTHRRARLTEFKLEYFAGLAIAAGVAFVAAVPASAGAPTCAEYKPGDDSKSGTIYFRINSSRLDHIPRCELARLAKLAVNEGASQVLITGHADQLGDPSYNLTLSQRRASRALAEMRRLGVNPASLKVDWKGEFDPAVPVGPDQPEASNRRVTIVITL